MLEINLLFYLLIYSTFVDLLISSAPSSPPSDFRGHNLSSTSIQVNWEDVPKSSVNGILLGFHVACNLVNCSEGQVIDLPRENHSCVFRGLEKYKNYSCCLRAYNNFGNGSWSEELVISTDEDGMMNG